MDNFDLIRTLKYLPGIIIGLTFHEFSHALIAKKCGDNTSHDQGRVTLNPLKHIDPMGFILLLIAGFGWAKPVQFNEMNLRNPKTDVLKIAIAGPLSNAILAMVLSMILAFSARSGFTGQGSAGLVIYEIVVYAIFINWSLFIFNLLPIPPLDGSHLLFHPFRKYPEVYQWLYKYGSMLLFGLLIFSAVTKINVLPIWPLIRFFGEGFLGLLGFTI